MPYFMDRHDLVGATPEAIAQAHVKDIEVQGRFNVRFIHYWYDHDRQHAFCLAQGPDLDTITAAHEAAHGLLPNRVIEVDEESVTAFLGGFVPRAVGEAYTDTAFRVIMFTDIVDSTKLTQRLGDAGAMAVLHRHDLIVQNALDDYGGLRVKHTGDGAMASFQTVHAAIEAAIRIQRAVSDKTDNGEAFAIRIGIAAGEPVAEGDDLFGSAVQLAARLTARADPGTVMVSGAVRDLAIGKGIKFGPSKSVRLKGFEEAIRACEVIW
ncbi:MAG TPA: nickel-binding protein [Acidimicrobiia bacterium]|nr:nickel-binding protein [Acidimicrobiia bacterium]